MDVNNPDHTNGFWFFCKRPEWSNEEEVRLVLPRGMGSKVKLKPRWLKRLISGKAYPNITSRSFGLGQGNQCLPSVVKARYDAVDQKLILGP
jgi:hypothetical protein